MVLKKHNVIYMLRNKENGMCYIGQHSTDDLNDGYMGSGRAIAKAIKQYGKECFEKTILCYCTSRKEMNEKERYYIEMYDTFNNGYNQTQGGEGLLGFSVSETQKQEHSAMMKQWNKEHPESAMRLSEYAKTRIGSLNPFYGKKLPKEHIEKMRRARVKAITGANNPSAKQVVCIETGEVFDMAKSASMQYGNTQDPCMIIKCCRGRAKSAYGKH